MLKISTLALIAALRDRRGVSSAEYAILATAIVLAVGAAVTAFGPKLTTAFSGILS